MKTTLLKKTIKSRPPHNSLLKPKKDFLAGQLQSGLLVLQGICRGLPAKKILLYAFKSWLLLASIALLPSGRALAQTIVESVRLEVNGGQKINPDAALAHITLREGMEYSPLLLDQSIRSLYDSGAYDLVEVRKQVDDQGNHLNLTFLLVTKYRVQCLQFDGNCKFSDHKLQKKIKTTQSSLLSEVDVKIDAEKIAKFYVDEGFPYARVTYTIDRNEQLGEATVRFNICEGQYYRLMDISFKGNNCMDSDDIQEVMHSKTWWIFSWLTDGGMLQESVLIEDLGRIAAAYKDWGYLDVEVPTSGIEYCYPGKDRVTVSIQINEGRQYHVGNISIEGNTLYPSEKLECVVGLQSGDVFSPKALNESLENLRDYYGHFGYLETQVRVERLPNLQTGTIDLVFYIKESGKFYVETILLEGNTRTKANVILRELALAPGDVFDLVRMKASEERLKNTLFFDEVNLSPEVVSVPNHRNLRITLKEKRTGNVQFGLGFSSVEQAVAFVEITQSNFDVTNFRNYCRGGGQKMRLRLSVGNKSNSIFFNFEEPSVYDRELAAGFDLFRNDSKYTSNNYDELRYGIELYLRKRLVELFVIRPYYRLEVVDLHNISNSASNVIKSQGGEHTMSIIGFSISRETLDNFIMPNTGTRLKFIADLAGLGGSEKYLRLEVQGGRWWPTFETLRQVFSVIGRTGTITAYGNTPVPFFETYYLGGPNNLRGYHYRDIGPRDAAGEVIGGDTYAYGSMEYSFQVLPPVRLAAFYDIGFVNAGHWNWSTANYAHDIGVGARVLVMGAPVRLDFAYPLRVRDGESKNWQFSFSFGTIF